MHERIAHRPETKTERRKAIRFPVVIPVEAKWIGVSGKTVKQTGQAKEANALGGLLDMKTHPIVGSEIELTNTLSGETLRARVVGPRRSKKGEAFGVAVAFLIPSETFWGVNFQLKKTSADLAKIEQTIRSGGIAPSILTEFRDAVDHVRRTAWAVQEWQERQLLNRDPQTVLPLITTERIRRATQLSKAITLDLAAQEVTRDTAGIDELLQAVDSLQQRVADLLKGREPR
jgi:hypothetical protein